MTFFVQRAALVLMCAVLLGGVAGAQDIGPLVIAKQGHFFVGGRYVDQPNGQLMVGQSYVEYWIPKNRTHRYPLVMIEGCCTSGAAYEGTPDGRDGWMQYFVAHGW